MPLLFHVTVLKTCQLADGASVMIGKHNGVSAKLKLIDPVLIHIHCIAHRLTLATRTPSHTSRTLPEEIPSLPIPAWLLYICLLFLGFSNVYHFTCVWSTALKLGCITNFDTLFLLMGLISLVDEIQFAFKVYNSYSACVNCWLWKRIFWNENHCWENSVWLRLLVQNTGKPHYPRVSHSITNN